MATQPPVGFAILHCQRCGYDWPLRPGRQPPKTCANPNCKSPYWNKPRTNPAAIAAAEAKGKKPARRKRRAA